MKILSIQIGQPKEINYQGKPVLTGIFKTPVSGPIQVRATNLEGDGQADLAVHGGVEKAVYAFSFDAYEWWKVQRPEDQYDFGSMGENLSIDHFDETQMYVGDTFEVGTTVLQVSLPRTPCFKLAAKFNDPSIIKTFNESGRPGVYFRVLKEGSITAGDEMKLVSRETVRLSVMELYKLSPAVVYEKDRVVEILSIKSLAPGTRKKFQARMDQF